MTKYKIECPNCGHEFTKERIVLFEKNKKEIKEKTKVEELAPCVKELIKQLSTRTIEIKDIEKITVITADKEQPLRQKKNPGMAIEVTIIPGLEPHK